VTPCEYVDELRISKTRYSEEGIILRSFVVTPYRRVTEGQTDRQKRYIANTSRSIAAHCENRLRTYREILPEDRQRDKQTRRTFSRASLRICFQLGQ